jgi:hypothetical protein
MIKQDWQAEAVATSPVGDERAVHGGIFPPKGNIFD